MSLACDRYLCMHGVRHVLVCLGVRFVQNFFTGADVSGNSGPVCDRRLCRRDVRFVLNRGGLFSQ